MKQILFRNPGGTEQTVYTKLSFRCLCMKARAKAKYHLEQRANIYSFFDQINSYDNQNCGNVM